MSPAVGTMDGDGVLAQDVRTARGTFATLASRPTTRPVARGSVLLLPGFTGSKEDLAPVLPLFADAGWAAATYDHRGQFESPGQPDDDYSLEAFAADALSVAAAVHGETEQVHLVGHSFGGLVAGVAAIHDPTRWASLTLLCSGPGGLTAGDIYDDALLVSDTMQRDGLEAVYLARRLRAQERGAGPVPDAVEALDHRRFLTSSPESLSAMARHLSGAPDRTAELAALDLTMGVVRGADDTWTHAVQDALADALGTHVEVIAGAAHSPAAEQPEATRDSLARIFLR